MKEIEIPLASTDKYEEALAKARFEYKENPCATEGEKKLLEIIFPELAESDDEKIRESLLRHFRRKYKTKPYWNGIAVKDIIAYLEKQKDILRERAQNITANMLEDRIEGIQYELIEFLSNAINASWVDIIKSADSYAERIKNIIEKQKAKDSYDRMAPIYENKESFESALDKAWKFYNESGSSTVDGCEDNAFELAFAKGFREGVLCEKQKEQKPNCKYGCPFTNEQLMATDYWKEYLKESIIPGNKPTKQDIDFLLPTARKYFSLIMKEVCTICKDYSNGYQKGLETVEQEQPEGDLEKIIEQTYRDGSVSDTSDMDHVTYENIARYFYELGLNVRKEE